MGEAVDGRKSSKTMLGSSTYAQTQKLAAQFDRKIADLRSVVDNEVETRRMFDEERDRAIHNADIAAIRASVEALEASDTIDRDRAGLIDEIFGVDFGKIRREKIFQLLEEKGRMQHRIDVTKARAQRAEADLLSMSTEREDLQEMLRNNAINLDLHNDKMNKVQVENDKLESEISKLRHEVQVLTDDNTSLNGLSDYLEAENTRLMALNESTKHTLSSRPSQEAYDDLQDKCNTLQEAHEAASLRYSHQIANYNNKIQRLSIKLESAGAHIAKLDTAIGDEREDAMEARGQLEAELQHLKVEIEHAGTQIGSLEAQVSELHATVSEERAIAAEASIQNKTEIDRLLAELDSAVDEISALHATMRDERSNATVASTKMQTQHNDDMQRLSAELESMYAQVSTMESQVSGLRTTMGDERVIAAETKIQQDGVIQQLHDDLDSANVHISELNAAMGDAKSDAATIHDRMKSLLIEISRGALDIEVGSMSTSGVMDTMLSQVKVNRKTQTQLNRDLRRCKTHAAELERNVRRLTDEMDKRNEHDEKVGAEIEKLTHERDCLASSVEALRTELNAAHESYNALSIKSKSDDVEIERIRGLLNELRLEVSDNNTRLDERVKEFQKREHEMLISTTRNEEMRVELEAHYAKVHDAEDVLNILRTSFHIRHNSLLAREAIYQKKDRLIMEQESEIATLQSRIGEMRQADEVMRKELHDQMDIIQLKTAEISKLTTDMTNVRKTRQDSRTLASMLQSDLYRTTTILGSTRDELKSANIEISQYKAKQQNYQQLDDKMARLKIESVVDKAELTRLRKRVESLEKNDAVCTPASSHRSNVSPTPTPNSLLGARYIAAGAMAPRADLPAAPRADLPAPRPYVSLYAAPVAPEVRPAISQVRPADNIVFLVSGSVLHPVTSPHGPPRVISLVHEFIITWGERYEGREGSGMVGWNRLTGTNTRTPICMNRRANRAGLLANGAHDNINNPSHACEGCRLNRIPCVVLAQPRQAPIVLPLPEQYRVGLWLADAGYWVVQG